MSLTAETTTATTRPSRLPDELPPARLRELLVRLVLRAWTARLPIRVQDASGRTWGRGGPDSPLLRLERPTELYRRLAHDVNIGFGEAYQSGAWTSPDPAALLTVFAERLAGDVHPWLQSLRLRLQRIRGHAESNTQEVARRNAEAHYDLSNELFATFLDPTLTYSSAWFAPDDDDLERAQLRKIDAVLDYAEVGPGTSVLEIGTGWGALAIRAAQRGASVTSLTLSGEQRRLAQQRIAAAELSDRISVLLQDYRDASGTYDAVVSVEMIEAVGEEHWPEYFATIDRVLAPGGKAALQAITMPHERLAVSRRARTWINKYIFPGGLIPSERAIEETLETHTRLRVSARRAFGADYARTLAHWRTRFTAARAAVAELGFDSGFRRTWEYYLAYCEAGFRAGYIDVVQLQLRRGA